MSGTLLVYDTADAWPHWYILAILFTLCSRSFSNNSGLRRFLFTTSFRQWCKLARAKSILRKVSSESILFTSRYLLKVSSRYKVKILLKTIFKIQDKIVSCIFKIRYYLEDTILPNTALMTCIVIVVLFSVSRTYRRLWVRETGKLL